MKTSALAAVFFAVLSAAGPVLPRVGHRILRRQADSNPFDGKKLFVNPTYAEKLEQTVESFAIAGDTANADKTRAIKEIGTFVWISDIASLAHIDTAIEDARAAQAETGETQIVGLVLYNLPDRDCSAGESAGELIVSENGLERYKTEYIQPYAEKVSAATDLTFAIVLEPDSLGNLVTNMNVEKCANAADAYKEGIAHAISSLQFDNVHLYIDAAHGGWLGWDTNLQPTAEVFGEVVHKAGNSSHIRGYAINVSNYNPFKAEVPEPYTEYSNSADESSYATTLSPYLEAQGLPTRFIIDQGRVALPGARAEWGEWCNVAPSGFGIKPGTAVDNPLVDSIVWIKPGGESDGQCGMEGAPRAGQWFEEYVQMLVENADASITV
ncbi:putative exoglucanase 3 [Diaporthe ampelina]|uniref:Glucanase n=1 Tax=Diaporthe ampelina TaxID=1214573 RepID=A0A0G2FN03_9PEZI|nr:putative exoglucanase 3 [Diaporthe ampelina]